jgi:Tol biopolymer transport system component
VLAISVVSVVSLGFAASPQARAASTERVSVDNAGNQGNADSSDSAVSDDGRFVAYYSLASNLVPGDTNGAADIFVRDRQTGTTQRVSVDGAGNQGNGDSFGPALSADGRLVSFRSQASNLVPGDTNGAIDDFVYDRQSGAIERVSVDSTGTQGNGDSFETSISDNGRFVAFLSFASNLVPGDNNAVSDIFVHDLQTDTTERASVDSAGTTEANGQSYFPQISADGRFVAFRSDASDLVPGDTNGVSDIFVRDRQTGTTERVSVDGSGAEGNGDSFGPTISDNGRFVAFRSDSSNLVPGDTNGVSDIFVRDRQTGATERVSVDGAGVEGNGNSFGPSISEDGRFVAFRSHASNLVPGDLNGRDDIFVRDRQTGTTQLVSVANTGTQGDAPSFEPAISADGRFVAFRSDASTLVPGDTNASRDVFIRDTAASPSAPTLSATDPASPANDNSPRIEGFADPGSTVTLYATSDCSGSPAATGTAGDFASPGIAVSVADDSSTAFHATATDGGGNASACSAGSITYVEDSTAPSGGQITSALRVFALTTPFTVGWGGATDSASGVKSYDTYVRSAHYNGPFGSGALFETTSGPGTDGFSAQPGNSYCFHVTIIDNAGNGSAPSAERCTSLPVDDAALAGSGWTRATHRNGYYRGTRSRSSTKGATLSLAGVRAKRISLVATKCPGCGKVKVLQGGRALKTVRLVSRRVRKERVIAVANFQTVHRGKVKLRVATSGKPVIVDGLGVSRN